MKIRMFFLLISILLSVSAVAANASFAVTHLNTTVALNKNTSAKITEVINIKISNESLKQYQLDRVALNLKLEEWQSLIGPTLVQHIINTHFGVSNFSFIPGPVSVHNGSNTAQLYLNYEVLNVTTVKQIAPRAFSYKFNSTVFNFEHGASGEILPPNTTLTIDLPLGARNISVYPIPDLPANGLADKFNNATTLSWNNGEPLSRFTLNFELNENIQTEVVSFFTRVYDYLGYASYVIVILIILLFIFYTYFKAKS
ncbi:MAG: hypothetical protein M1331_02280 [Candidatus Marsarchaeota archaeon]|nr:hypothetical protein [Candidatus Marsarchaeota archaeon]